MTGMLSVYRRTGRSLVYKEELKTVVRELLACTQPNRHETFRALWNPYIVECPQGGDVRKYASAEERAVKKTENDRVPFWFYGESIRTSVHGSHSAIVKAQP